MVYVRAYWCAAGDDVDGGGCCVDEGFFEGSERHIDESFWERGNSKLLILFPNLNLHLYWGSVMK